MPPAPPPHLLPIAVAPPPAPAAPKSLLGGIAGALGMAPPQPAPAPHLLPITMGGALPPPTPAPAPTGILGSIAGALGMAPPQPTPVIAPPQNYLPLAPATPVQTVANAAQSAASAVSQAVQNAAPNLASALGLGAGSAPSSGNPFGSGPLPGLGGMFGGGGGGGATSPSGQMVGSGDASGAFTDSGYVPPGLTATAAPVTAPAPAGFLSTPIVGPVTPAELGLGAVAVGILGKVLKWW